MINRQATGIPVLSRDETVKIMDEMDRLLDEMRATMSMIKKLVSYDGAESAAASHEKVRSL
jgi:hypothetical protein